MENEAINGTNPEVGQTTPPESPKKFCKYCGERIDIDCVVCPKCGKQIEALRQDPSQVIINNNGSDYPYKSKTVALLLSIFVGGLGIYRFYVGKIGTGIIWLLTAGCLGVGWIIDIIMIAVGSFRDKAGMPLQ